MRYRTLFLVGCILLLPARSNGDWWLMDLYEYRLPTDVGLVEFRVGHEEVLNLPKDQTVDGLQEAGSILTDAIAESDVYFVMHDGGDVEYDMGWEPDNPFRAWWTNAMPCSLGNFQLQGQELSLYKRVLGGQVRFGLGGSTCDFGTYEWCDCTIPHEACSDPSSYDYLYIGLHELYHSFGIGHYDGCDDWDESIMLPYGDGDCTAHRTLGWVDEAYAGWIYDGIHSDEDEPDDDESSHATNLGTLSPDNDQLEDDGNELPGENDIDWKVFVVDGVPDHAYLTFYLIDQEGIGDIMMTIYQGPNRVADVDFNGPGGDEYYETETQDGSWFVAVYSSDFREVGEYVLIVQYNEQVAGATSAPRKGKPLFKVISKTHEVRGTGLPQEGRLRLYDVTGRLRGSWPIPSHRDWVITTRNLDLGSGFYFLRLTVPNIPAASERLVVVR